MGRTLLRDPAEAHISDPTGFAYTVRNSGEVVITHNGRRAAALRGDKASKFLARVTDGNAQALMARVTGNYKRGNESQS